MEADYVMKEKSITLNDSLKDIINLHILKAFKKKKSFSNKYSSCEIIRISNLNWKLTDFKVFESIRFQKLKSQFFFVPNILHTSRISACKKIAKTDST